MSLPIQRGQFGPSDRIAAFARATEVYAESLDDPDLANVYWGKSLGLWQAVAILSADDGGLPAKRSRTLAAPCRTRRARPAPPSPAVRPVEP
jgi:hypothetical protein